MHRSRWYLTLLGGALLVAAESSAQQASPSRDELRVTSLGFLAGCWQLARGPVQIAEQWLAPAGGTMLGVSRTVRGEHTVEYEFLRIIEREGQLVYIAMPSRQETTEFTAATAADSAVEFSNPAHDFPQRIRYARRGADSLVARIAGTVNGAERAREFAFVRGSCSD
jgi:hypothetical protein